MKGLQLVPKYVIEKLQNRAQALAHSRYGGDWEKLLVSVRKDEAGNVSFDEWRRILRMLVKVTPHDISDQHIEDLFLQLSHGNIVSGLSMSTIIEFLDHGSKEKIRQSMLLLREYDIPASSPHSIPRVRTTQSRAVRERMAKYLEDSSPNHSTDQPQYSTMCGLAVLASKSRLFDAAISQLQFENRILQQEIGSKSNSAPIISQEDE